MKPAGAGGRSAPRHKADAQAPTESDRGAHAAARGADWPPGLAGAPGAPRPRECITIGASARGHTTQRRTLLADDA